MALSRAQLRAWIRAYLRDTAEANSLKDGLETEDFLIDLCMEMAVSDFNTDPPFTTYRVEDFPSLKLLILGTVCEILGSAMLGQSRNHLPFNDGGLQVMTSDKAGLYQAMYQQFRAEVVNQRDSWKRAYNIARGYSGQHTEFAHLGAFATGLVGDSFEFSLSGLFS